ncbi:hypothetical protein CPB85DRAFT_1216294 [Mucidula mucida]|nr:hypothetical protein CPB85DRAFT_1216294 [Mucidula mucida]
MVGYGMEQPDPQWPNGAKIAISFVLTKPEVDDSQVINWEEGGERNILEGDSGSGSPLHLCKLARIVTHLVETFIIEHLSKPSVIGGRDHMTESQFEYGPRAGLPRLMRLFKK